VNHTRRIWRIYLPLLLPAILLFLAVLFIAIFSSQVLSTNVIVIVIALAVAAGVLAYVFARRLAISLMQIRAGVERIAQIDDSGRAKATFDNSVASLAVAVNDVARHLQERAAELTQRRQEHDTIVSSMIEGVLVVDADEKLISINQAAARLLGLENANVIGRSLQETVRNSDLHRLVTRTLEFGTPVEGDVILQGVEDRHLQVTGTMLRNATRDTVGALIVLNDVTRLRKLEQVRRDFVANVSHELKTPITSIKGYVETLLDGAFRNPDDIERFLKIVAKQANRLNAIIEDLLKLSRIEQGVERGEIVLEQTALKGLLAAAISACETQIAVKSIHVSLLCPDDLVARVNPPLLEQAVVNLIDNATKYGDAGSAIEIAAIQNSSAISIVVRDHGVGIAPEHLPRLFERFYRVDKARSRAEGGTGLGLAIAKHIVLAHGGTISVDSRMGEGSTFTISLPLR
jgi:two-component system, OmpR family, phosphate regulon sensor histidine kinase PhoR